MASVFAAAGQSADRRRRLIAHDGAIQDVELLREFGIVLEAELPVETPVNRIGERLIGRLISHRLWKHVTIVLAVLLTSCGLAFFVLSSHAKPHFNGSVSEQFDSQLRTAALQSVFGLTTILLVLSGQMALLIGWLRSHSSIDFDGRYRSWYRLSWFLLSLSVFSISGTSAVVTHLLAALLQPATGTITAARPALLFVPLVSTGMLIAWRLVPDMGRNRLSQILFLAAIGMAATCLTSLAPRLAVMLPPLAHAAGILLAASILFSACLLHCRFVAHINNDPPVASCRTDLLATDALADDDAAEQSCDSLGVDGPVSVDAVSDRPVSDDPHSFNHVSVANALVSKTQAVRNAATPPTAVSTPDNSQAVAGSGAKKTEATAHTLRSNKPRVLNQQCAALDDSCDSKSKPKSARAGKARRTAARKAG